MVQRVCHRNRCEAAHMPHPLDFDSAGVTIKLRHWVTRPPFSPCEDSFMTDAYVYDAIRTPRGRGKKKTGSLHEVKPISLVTGLIDELQKRNPTLDPNGIEDVVLGVVSPVGDQGSDIAK